MLPGGGRSQVLKEVVFFPDLTLSKDLAHPSQALFTESHCGAIFFTLCFLRLSPKGQLGPSLRVLAPTSLARTGVPESSGISAWPGPQQVRWGRGCGAPSPPDCRAAGPWSITASAQSKAGSHPLIQLLSADPSGGRLVVPRPKPTAVGPS